VGVIERMNRREFLRYAAIAGPLGSLPQASARAPVPEIAFTFYDPTTDRGASLTWQEVNERILSSLDNNKIKSVLFVSGKRVDSAPGKQLVAAWDRAGHLMPGFVFTKLYEALNAFFV
jgi:peptidoglycan-N-acetylglucosamine deacetylase